MPFVLCDYGEPINLPITEYLALVEGNHHLSKFNKNLVKRKLKNLILIGADPEFFIGNDKKLIPSCGLIGGDKGKGVSIPGGGMSTWLEDNVAVELNFQPSSDSSTFAHTVKHSIAASIKALQTMKLHAIFKPAVTFKDADLIHPKAGRFGCEPDYCAYDQDTSKARKCDVNAFGNTRFAGGHLHVSFINKEKIPTYAIVMLLDALIGLPSVHYDKQGPRRKAYGLAGLHRTKKYSEEVEGIEYRSLSNFWLPLANGDPNEYHVVETLGETLLSIGVAAQERPNELSKLFIRLPLRDIQQCIDTEDAGRANEIWNFVRHLPELSDCYISTAFRPGLIKTPT